MKAGLQLRLAQHLTLTPQLQQSIRLLQLSTLELQQEIQTALAENPLLELADGDSEGDDGGAADAAPELFVAPVDREQLLDGSDVMGSFSTTERDEATSAANGASDVTDMADAKLGIEVADSMTSSSSAEGDGEYDAQSLDLGDWGGSAAGSFDDDDESFESQRASPPSLREHLRAQLVVIKAAPMILQLVHGLIDSLDEHGFMAVTKDDLDALVSRDGGVDATIDANDWQQAIDILQSLDPAGVGAADLRECLLLQLRHKPNNGDTKLARRIVSEALDQLGRRDYSRIKKLLDIDDIDLKDAHAVIRTLTPRPGAAFVDVSATLMIPDIIVRRSKRRWIAELNPTAVPKLTVNSVYADMLHRQKEGRSTPLSTQLQEARWLVKNVAQRFDTILRVSSEIVERQQAFFDHGEVAMRPLVLREVADVLGLHESTVSRVTTQKYLSSLRGSFELKYFFGSHVATEAGGAASSTAIRSMIKTLITEEDAAQPLTDSRIAELLGEQGIIVARRTVAKYRELQNIAPVNLRRRG
jgi:RNA polymerase sigma-54 factor